MTTRYSPKINRFTVKVYKFPTKFNGTAGMYVFLGLQGAVMEAGDIR
jgi:hypothetical protein